MVVLFNIPYLRQVFGFFLLTFLPGFLFTNISLLGKFNFYDRMVLSVGLSASFLMFFGLLINFVFPLFGLSHPLDSLLLMPSISLVLLILVLGEYKYYPRFIFIRYSDLYLSNHDKIFLSFGLLFPILSIYGMRLLTYYADNSLLMIYLILIPIYIASLCIYNTSISPKAYPIISLCICFSLLLLFMLRYPHICGHDVHLEYGYFFKNTFSHLFWSPMLGNNSVDACLSISLLPTIYQSILNTDNDEAFFKFLYLFICSFSPIIIYLSLRNYFDDIYAFLGSLFFMIQSTFLTTAGSPRTNIAIFFVSLFIFVVFSNRFNIITKRLLSIIFIFSIIVSHYSTAYILLIILIITIVISLILLKFGLDEININSVFLYFILLFTWYSLIIKTAFEAGVSAILKTLLSLHEMFIEDSKSQEVQILFGQNLPHPELSFLYLAVTWIVFILIGIGSIIMVARRINILGLNIAANRISKLFDLKHNYKDQYLVIVLAFCIILILTVIFPYASIGYELDRIFSLSIVTLSFPLIIGSIVISNYAGIKPQIFILIIWILLFLFKLGLIYQIANIPTSMLLNSDGKGLDLEYIHDTDSSSANWLKKNRIDDTLIFALDPLGKMALLSQGSFRRGVVLFSFDSKYANRTSFVYLMYNNIVKGNIGIEHINDIMHSYLMSLQGKNKLMDTGSSNIYYG